jgi:hypothetical protein
MNSVPRAALGKASGVFNTLRQLGAVFGVAILAAVFSARGSYATAQTFADGVAPALAVSAALAVAGALNALAIPGRRGAADAVAAGVEADGDILREVVAGVS